MASLCARYWSRSSFFNSLNPGTNSVRQVVLLLLLHRWENGGTEMFSHLFRVIQPSRVKFGIQVLQSPLIHSLWKHIFKMCFSLPPTSDNPWLLRNPSFTKSSSLCYSSHSQTCSPRGFSVSFLPVVRRLSSGWYLSLPHLFFFNSLFGGQGRMWGHVGGQGTEPLGCSYSNLLPWA